MSTSRSGRPARPEAPPRPAPRGGSRLRAARRAEHHVGALELLDDPVEGTASPPNCAASFSARSSRWFATKTFSAPRSRKLVAASAPILPGADQEDPLAGERPDACARPAPRPRRGSRRAASPPRSRAGRACPHGAPCSNARLEHRPGRVGLRRRARTPRAPGRGSATRPGSSESSPAATRKRWSAASTPRSSIRKSASPSTAPGTRRGRVRIARLRRTARCGCRSTGRPPRRPSSASRASDLERRIRAPGAAARAGRAKRCGGTLPRARVKPRNAPLGAHGVDATTLRAGRRFVRTVA